MPKKLLLTRSNDDNQLLNEKFIQAHLGIDILNFALLDYSYIDFDTHILKNYTDLVITSKRGLFSLENSLSKDKRDEYIQKNINLWIVGSSSAVQATKYFKSHRLYDNINVELVAPNAEYLKKHLIEDEARKYIYLSGKNISQDMPEFCERKIIYQCIYKETLDDEEINILKSNIDIALIYSKNCAKTLLNLLEKYKLSKYLDNTLFIAISSKLGHYMKDHFQNVVHVESPEYVVREVMKYAKK